MVSRDDILSERAGVRVKFPHPCRQRVLAGVKRKIVVLAGHRKEGVGKSIPEAHPEAPLP